MGKSISALATNELVDNDIKETITAYPNHKRNKPLDFDQKYNKIMVSTRATIKSNDREVRNNVCLSKPEFTSGIKNVHIIAITPGLAKRASDQIENL